MTRVYIYIEIPYIGVIQSTQQTTITVKGYKGCKALQSIKPYASLCPNVVYLLD